jgi:hypothetical protein
MEANMSDREILADVVLRLFESGECWSLGTFQYHDGPTHELMIDGKVEITEDEMEAIHRVAGPDWFARLDERRKARARA